MTGSQKDHEWLLRCLMEQTTDSIYFKDAQSRFIVVNKTCALKHGLDRNAIRGKTDFDTFAMEHAERAYQQEQEIIRTGEPLRDIEEKEVWPDGRVTWVSTTKMPLRDKDGRIIGIFGITRDITERKEAELRVQRYSEEIRLIKEEIENDVRMAGQLQKGFSPRSYPDFRGADGAPCISFLHSCTSSRDISGDYCSINKISDHEVGLFICDVSGIGIRAALGTALISGIIQEVSEQANDPGAYLTRINKLLYPLLHQEESTLDVTACFLVLDVGTGAIRGSSAGHPAPILIRGQGAASWLSDCENAQGPSLAVASGHQYRTVERRIDEGDAVVMYSDGIVNVRNGTGDAYGMKRLLDSAQSLMGDPLDEIFDALQGDALSFAWNGSFDDDVCLVGFRLDSKMS